jgi:hypothetical protein
VAAPPYAIEPAQPPFAHAASGAPITVPGTKFLRLMIHPAWTLDPFAPGVPATYTGPKEFSPTGTNAVRGLALFDDYEAHVGWFIGLDGSGRYTVETSTAPPSITITIGR